jgi:hypothetical protein
MIAYIKARLNERSTWLALGAGAAAGAALMPPWSYIAAVAAFMAAMIPDGGVK